MARAKQSGVLEGKGGTLNGDSYRNQKKKTTARCRGSIVLCVRKRGGEARKEGTLCGGHREGYGKMSEMVSKRRVV